MATHTIEHAEQGGSFERMTRVVSVTDWLLGLAKGQRSEQEPGYALGYVDSGFTQDPRRRVRDDGRS